MTYWEIIYIIDLVLFVFVSLTVGYMGIFALASMFSQHTEVPKAKKQNRFIIIIPAFKNGQATLKTVRSILGQDYPQRLFDVTVVSDHLDEMSNFRLAQQPVTLLTPNFKKSSRAKAYQLAINNLPQFKLYDVVAILYPGNIVDTNYLTEMNDAYESAGTKAIQAHLLSQNRDTAPAFLSAVFEEINNSIFRRGHITLGLSSASAGTAMAYDFEWFKKNVKELSNVGEDKELEIRLLRQHIYIDYFDNIMVFAEKYRKAEEFNSQHGRWYKSQLAAPLRNIQYLPQALLERQYDIIDKILQWMLLPRTVMMSFIFLMGFITPVIYFSLAVKWWLLFAGVLFIFALATPNYLVDDKWDRAFFKVPVMFLNIILSKTHLGPKLKAFINQKL